MELGELNLAPKTLEKGEPLPGIFPWAYGKAAQASRLLVLTTKHRHAACRLTCCNTTFTFLGKHTLGSTSCVLLRCARIRFCYRLSSQLEETVPRSGVATRNYLLGACGSKSVMSGGNLCHFGSWTWTPENVFAISQLFSGLLPWLPLPRRGKAS